MRPVWRPQQVGLRTSAGTGAPRGRPVSREVGSLRGPHARRARNLVPPVSTPPRPRASAFWRTPPRLRLRVLRHHPARMSSTDPPSLAARLERLLPDPPDLALTGPRWCGAARMDDVAAALQAVLDTRPDGHPDLPDWVQRLLAGGHATLVEATVLLTLAPLLRRLCDAPKRRWTEQDSAAAWGVIASLDVLDRTCAWWCDVLSAALEAHTTRPCSALFPWELPDAALHLITLADRAGIPVPAAFLDGSLPVLLDVLAATTPTHPLAALHRPGVLPDTLRVHRLRALLDPAHPAPQVPFGQGDHDAHWHHAAALVGRGARAHRRAGREDPAASRGCRHPRRPGRPGSRSPCGGS